MHIASGRGRADRLAKAVRIDTNPNEMEPEQIDGRGATETGSKGEAGRRDRQDLRAVPRRGLPNVGSFDRDHPKSPVGTPTSDSCRARHPLFYLGGIWSSTSIQ